jgi:hypothetical protein
MPTTNPLPPPRTQNTHLTPTRAQSGLARVLRGLLDTRRTKRAPSAQARLVLGVVALRDADGSMLSRRLAHTTSAFTSAPHARISCARPPCRRGSHATRPAGGACPAMCGVHDFRCPEGAELGSRGAFQSLHPTPRLASEPPRRNVPSPLCICNAGSCRGLPGPCIRREARSAAVSQLVGGRDSSWAPSSVLVSLRLVRSVRCAGLGLRRGCRSLGRCVGLFPRRGCVGLFRCGIARRVPCWRRGRRFLGCGLRLSQ